MFEFQNLAPLSSKLEKSHSIHWFVLINLFNCIDDSAKADELINKVKIAN
jgi:hypothetical protein